MGTQYKFGRAEIRPDERMLLVDGRVATIGARAFDVLLTLVVRRDRVVAKRELIERVWPGLVVEENNLQVQISTLRRVLGAQAIATVPGLGYRFVLPVGDPAAPSKDVAASPEPGTPHNLIPERSRFIGREHELEECRNLLRDARLLSLVAIGGCGKTRMALKLAQLLLDEHADGVWFIEFASLQDAARVPLALGAAIGVFEQTGLPLIERLTLHLAGHRALIVLDNCEHVAGAVAELVDRLLRAGAQLRFIATSRVPLGLAGERVFALPPLACPPARATPASEPECFDAMRLLVDRLQWSLPDFKLERSNVGVVAEICRRLDGIPLALELAAARAKVLSLAEILARLDDRFRLLKGAARPQQRPQTLRSTIQWSYDQLAPDAQRLFRCLGLFAGGGTLESIAAVAGPAPSGSYSAEEFEVLDELANLVDQSLVVVKQQPASGSRYGLLETVRLFACEQLELASEAPELRTRHLQHFARWVEQGFPRLNGAGQRDWFLQLDLERENLLLAHAWSVHGPAGVDAGLCLTAFLQGYWRSRGIADLGYRLARDAVVRALDRPASLTHSQALFAAGDLAYFLGNYGDAQSLLARSRSMAHALGEPKQEALSQLMLGMACLGNSDRATALHHCEASLVLTRALGDRGALNTAVMALGVVHMALGRLDSAAPLLNESLEIARERGSPSLLGISLVNVAWIAIGRASSELARTRLLEAIEIAEDIGHESLSQMVVDAFVGWAADLRQWEQAARLCGAAQASIDQMQLHRQPAIEAMLAPHIERIAAALGAAAFERLQAEGRLIGLHNAVAVVKASLEQWGMLAPTEN